MKIRFTHFIVFASFCMFSACTPQKEQKPFCLGDIYKHILLSSSSNFIPLMDTVSASADPKRKAGYVEGNGSTYSYYYTSLYVNDLCNRDNPMIEFEIFLNNEDPQAVLTGYVQEEGSSVIHEYPLELDDSNPFYGINVGHEFETVSGHTPGSLYVHLKFRFPHQGSASADSLYFFSNLYQFNTKVSSLAQGIP